MPALGPNGATLRLFLLSSAHPLSERVCSGSILIHHHITIPYHTIPYQTKPYIQRSSFLPTCLPRYPFLAAMSSLWVRWTGRERERETGNGNRRGGGRMGANLGMVD